MKIGNFNEKLLYSNFPNWAERTIFYSFFVLWNGTLKLLRPRATVTAEKMKLSTKDFFSK